MACPLLWAAIKIALEISNKEMTRAVTYGHQNMLQLNRPLIKSESAVTRSLSCTISEILPRFQHTQMSVISKSLSALMAFNIIGQSFKHITKHITANICYIYDKQLTWLGLQIEYRLLACDRKPSIHSMYQSMHMCCIPTRPVKITNKNICN